METSRRSFLKGLGLFTAGMVVAPEIPLQRFWALGAPLEQTAAGITVLKARALIVISNELIRDSAPAVEQIIRHHTARWMQTDESRVRWRVGATQPVTAFQQDQTWYEAWVA